MSKKIEDSLGEVLSELFKVIKESNAEDSPSKDSEPQNKEDEKPFDIDNCSEDKFQDHLIDVYNKDQKHTSSLKRIYKLSPDIAAYLWVFIRDLSEIERGIKDIQKAIRHVHDRVCK